MKKLAVVVLVMVLAVSFAVPAFAATCKPCKPCPKPAPCVTCGSADSLFQSMANAINCVKAPDLVMGPNSCNTCAKPAPKPSRPSGK